MFRIDICQDARKKCIKTKIFRQKVLPVREKCVPLHPLNRKAILRGNKGRVL